MRRTTLKIITSFNRDIKEYEDKIKQLQEHIKTCKEIIEDAKLKDDTYKEGKLK